MLIHYLPVMSAKITPGVKLETYPVIKRAGGQNGIGECWIGSSLLFSIVRDCHSIREHGYNGYIGFVFHVATELAGDEALHTGRDSGIDESLSAFNSVLCNQINDNVLPFENLNKGGGSEVTSELLDAGCKFRLGGWATEYGDIEGASLEKCRDD